LDDADDSDNNDVCLITNQPLTENYVTLDCNHKFNYMPLFNDIKNHKKKFNSLEAHRLGQNEIRCPYCRNKQKKLLPYYPSMGENMKVLGVNAMPEPPPGWEHGICSFYPEDNPEKKYCSINVILLSNNQKYCQMHCSTMNYKIKKEAERKLKEEAKQKAKEELKKAKEELKQKIKEEKEKEKQKLKEIKEQEKQKAKEEKQKISGKKKATNEEDDKVPKTKKAKIVAPQETEELEDNNENVVISVQTCTQMIKYGANKGHQCKGKVHLMGVCKRHYNLSILQNESSEISSVSNLQTIGPIEVKTATNTSLDINEK
jgi:hypothetical protein